MWTYKTVKILNHKNIKLVKHQIVKLQYYENTQNYETPDCKNT